jgi:hypothetical protein
MSKATTSQPRKRNNPDNWRGREASVSKPHTPTDQERVLVENFFENRKKETPSRKMKAEKENDGKIAISSEHKDGTVAYALLAKTLGTTGAEFINGILTQLASLGRVMICAVAK